MSDNKTVKSTNGDIYVGEFLRDERSGEGIFLSSEGPQIGKWPHDFMTYKITDDNELKQIAMQLALRPFTLPCFNP